MTFARYYGLEAADGRANELADALQMLANRVRSCEGCEKVELLKEVDDSSAFVLIEFWESADSHKAAGRTLGKDAFAPVLTALRKPPAFRDLCVVSGIS